VGGVRNARKQKGREKRREEEEDRRTADPKNTVYEEERECLCAGGTLPWSMFGSILVKGSHQWVKRDRGERKQRCTRAGTKA